MNNFTFSKELDAKSLIEETHRSLRALEESIKKLHAYGIHKELHMRNSSQIVVAYPSKQHLLPTPQENIFCTSTNTKKVLYIHIPFCTGICTYCGYARTAISKHDEKIIKYISLLKKESNMVKTALGVDKIEVDSIYIGGGTPTLLKTKQLKELFNLINRDYRLIENGEYTLEGSPETITIEKIQLAVKAGVNRVSIGVESFDDETLTSIARRHTAKEALDALDKIREGGIENIDFDLIRGLPGYNSDLVIKDLKYICESQIPSITSYQYSLKPRTIDFKKHHNDYSYDESEQIFMHMLFILGMEKAGYKHQSPIIDCFIKNESHTFKHSIQKWSYMCELISLGQGAYGFYNNIKTGTG